MPRPIVALLNTTIGNKWYSERWLSEFEGIVEAQKNNR
jgi:hypothetical protein